MKQVFMQLFASKKRDNKPDTKIHGDFKDVKLQDISRGKKAKAIHEVGERYGRAITRLSDT